MSDRENRQLGTASIGGRIQSRLAWLVGKRLFWAIFVGSIFAAPLVRGLRAGPPPRAPASIGGFPAFALQDDRGERVESAQLRGHVFLANLLCVRCTEMGSLAAETMRRLQHRARNLGDALRLVSFSEDGDPAALAAVRRAQASSGRWMLLAGAPIEVRTLFPEGRGLLLVDGEQRIRGRYSGSDEETLGAALRDAALVLNGH